MPMNLGLTHISSIAKLEKNSGAIVQQSLQGFKRNATDQALIIEQLRNAGIYGRTAVILLEDGFNLMRYTLDRLHFLPYLCNTQKAITAPPR